MDYSIRMPSLWENSSVTMWLIAGGLKEFKPFLTAICPKVNIIAWQKFEHAYNTIHFASGTPPRFHGMTKNQKISLDIKLLKTCRLYVETK